MSSVKSVQVTKISASRTQTVTSVQGTVNIKESFEEFSSPSGKLFFENAALKMSPGWVSGHRGLFDSPKSVSPIRPPKTRRSSIHVKKAILAAPGVDSDFKKPAVFISPTGVKTRARRSSIYHKSSKNLLTGLSPKSRRDSLAAVRSKKLVSNSDYVFAVPDADISKRKKLVSKSTKAKKAAESSPKRTSSKSRVKSSSPVKKSVREMKLKEADSSKPARQTIKVITGKKKSTPKKEKTARSKSKAKSPPKEAKDLSDDDNIDDRDNVVDNNNEVEEAIISPRRTRKTPGKSRKRSLSTVTKSAKKRKRSPSKSPSPKKKSSPSPKKKESSSTKRKASPSPKKKSPSPKKSVTKRSSQSSKKQKVVKESQGTSIEDSINLDHDKESESVSLTKSPKSTSKTSPKSAAKKTPKSSKKTPKSSTRKQTKKTPSSQKRLTTKSSSKKPVKKSHTGSGTSKSDDVAKALDFQSTDQFDSQTDVDEEDGNLMSSTSKTSPISKQTLSPEKMKSILDSVSTLTAPSDTEKKRKTTDFQEPQSANKRRRFDRERFEKIVASTPRDMRLDILSGRRPELSPITGSSNKNINNSLSMSKQVTVFSNKSTFLSVGPSNLSPVAAGSPLMVTEVQSRVTEDFVDGNDDDFEQNGHDLDYTNISCAKNPTEEPYLFDYDSELDSSHSNVRAGCTIL